MILFSETVASVAVIAARSRAARSAARIEPVAALNNGAMFGTAAMLDGLADRVEAELGQPLTVVATGGLAPYIMPCCKRKIIYDADLLFKGLALTWERNGK